MTGWSQANCLTLASASVSKKSNEIPAIHDILDQFFIQEKDIITIDAIGCQKSMVSKIRNQKADYVIALKGNQQKLSDEIANFFDQAVLAPEYTTCLNTSLECKGHGRKEEYEVWVCCEIDWLPEIDKWKGLSSVVMVKPIHDESQKRYYISSLKADPEEFDGIIRNHWSIENELHWHLDVTFGEDDSQIGAKANENLRTIRLVCLELLKKETSFQKGLKAKMKKCHRSDDYLKKVLISEIF